MSEAPSSGPSRTFTYNTTVSWKGEHRGRVVMGNGPEMDFSAPPEAHGHAGVLTPEMVVTMAEQPLIFAMANPVPEIMPEQARAAGAAIIGTGRSDYPNQINNALAFPGVFRGALDVHARKIDDDMKVAAAHALAGYVKRPARDHIMPPVLDRSVVKVVAAAVSSAARGSGMARDVG